MTSKGKETEDDIYCACLSKALCQVATPVTVGLYAPFGGRVYMLLDRITKCMREEASRITEKEETALKRTSVKPHGWGFLQLLWRLLFYCPVITSRHQERKSIQFIFVHFSAWQYAGSDRLWAGLVTTLCDRIRKHFGILPLSVFNVLGSVPKISLEEEDVKEWKFKKYFFIILVVIIILLLIGLVLLVAPINFRSHEERISTAFGGLATVIAGSGIAMTLFKLCKSVLISQKQKIERLVNSQKFSSQMGFMNEVKKEVELITQMVQYMEIFQKQKIRVVLQITSLELCAPEKVVGVLDAMNTLLSDQRSPFISILVVDPSIIVTCLESAGSLKGMADNGYMFLNRTVTLPFSVPALGKKTKLQLLRKAVQRTEDLIDWPCRNDANRGTKTGIAESMKLLREELSEDDDSEERTPIFQPAYCIQEAFYALYSEREVLHEYIPDSICQMKRIVNAIPVMVHLMMLSKIPWGNLSAKSVAAWVVLCNQWPCRLSWILQCLEDEEQRGSKEGFCNCLLWDVFKENSKELFAMKTGLKNLLDLDGDPEIFQKFLSKDFPFTVEESRRLLKCTINLDFSIKNKMGLHRGINSLQNDWKEAAVNKTEIEVDICVNHGNNRMKTIEEEGLGCSKDAERRNISRMQWKEASWFKSEVNEEIDERPIWTKQEKVIEGLREEPERNIHTNLFKSEVNKEIGDGPIWTMQEKVVEGATEKPERNVHTNLFNSGLNENIGEGPVWTMQEKVCEGATEAPERNIHTNLFTSEVHAEIGEGPIWAMQEKVFEGLREEPERNIHTNLFKSGVNEEIGEGPIWAMQEKLIEGPREEPERNIHTNLFKSGVNEEIGEGPIWAMQEKLIEGPREEPERNIHTNLFKSGVNEKTGEGPIWAMQEKLIEGPREEPERNIHTNLFKSGVNEEIGEGPIWAMQEKLIEGLREEPERNIHTNLFKSEVNAEIVEGPIWTMQEKKIEGLREEPERNIHTNLFKSGVNEKIGEGPIWAMQEKVVEGATEELERNVHTNLFKSEVNEEIGEGPIWAMQEKVVEGATEKPERNVHTNLFKSEVNEEIGEGPIWAMQEKLIEGLREESERNIHTNLFKSEVNAEIVEGPIWTMQEKKIEGLREEPERNIHTNLFKSGVNEKIGEGPIWAMQEKVVEGATEELERNVHTNLFKSEVNEEIGEGPVWTMQEKVFDGATEDPERNVHTTPTLEHCTECDCRQCKPVNDTSVIELFLDNSNGGLITQIQNDDVKHILQTQSIAKAESIEDNEFQKLSAKLIMVHDEEEEEEPDHTMQIQIKERLV